MVVGFIAEKCTDSLFGGSEPETSKLQYTLQYVHRNAMTRAAAFGSTGLGIYSVLFLTIGFYSTQKNVRSYQKAQISEIT